MSETKIRYGVIGVGRHGSRYVEHLLGGVNHARLAAISRRNAEAGAKDAKRWGVDWIDDWNKLIAQPEIDAVVICVPCTQHRQMAVSALEAGKHVLLEKPLASNLKEGHAIAQAAHHAAQRGVRLFFAHTLRYSNVVRAVMKHRHRVGKLVAINLDQRLEHKPLAWEHSASHSGGGTILQTGVHMFDLIRFFSDDEVRSVQCNFGHVLEKEVEDRFAAIMETFGGVQITVEGGKYLKGRTGRIELIGDQGALLGDHVHNTLEFLSDRRSSPINVGQPAMTVGKVLTEATRSFLGKKEAEIGVQDGLASLAIADACYRAARSGNREPVES